MHDTKKKGIFQPPNETVFTEKHIFVGLLDLHV